MGRVLVIVIAALLTIYCVVEVAQADPDEVRALPRWMWATIIIVLPVIGAIAWLLWGRPRRSQIDRSKYRPIAPDDDPDFLRGL